MKRGAIGVRGRIFDVLLLAIFAYFECRGHQIRQMERMWDIRTAPRHVIKGVTRRCRCDREGSIGLLTYRSRPLPDYGRKRCSHSLSRIRGRSIASSSASALVSKLASLWVLGWACRWGYRLVLLLEMVLDSMWVMHSAMPISRSWCPTKGT